MQNSELHPALRGLTIREASETAYHDLIARGVPHRLAVLVRGLTPSEARNVTPATLVELGYEAA